MAIHCAVDGQMIYEAIASTELDGYLRSMTHTRVRSGGSSIRSVLRDPRFALDLSTVPQ
jgi:hypothetical protein